MNALPSTLVACLLATLPAAAGPGEKPKPAAPPKTAASKPTPANARLAQLQDRRSNGHFPRCTLGIELPDIPAVEAKAARVVVTKAVDDLGTNLVREDAAEARLEPTQRGQLGKPDGKPSPPTIVFAEMKNPPRKAKALKEVSGEIELFIPSRDPNGEARIEKLLTLAGKSLAHPALKANGVSMSLLSPAQVAAERKKAEATETAKLRKEGHTDEESIKSMVDSTLWSFPKGDEKIVLKVTDPRKAIESLTTFDGAGQRVYAMPSEVAGFTVLEVFNDKPKPDWSLVVAMRSEKSLVRHTFTFKDVPLP